MIRFLFRPEVNLILSVAMFLSGLGLSIGRAINIVGVSEPPLIFHMSAMALLVSGYGNILVSVVRKENANESSTNGG